MPPVLVSHARQTHWFPQNFNENKPVRRKSLVPKWKTGRYMEVWANNFKTQRNSSISGTDEDGLYVHIKRKHNSK